MSLTVGVVVGVAIGLGLGWSLGRRFGSTRPVKPTSLSWAAFGLGLAAVLVLASALFLPLELPGAVGSAFNTAQISVVLSVAGVTDALWAIVRRDRHWVSWTALVLAALPTVFWALFVIGHLWEPTA
jgi:predicted cobalt transporter CbtA